MQECRETKVVFREGVKHVLSKHYREAEREQHEDEEIIEEEGA